MHKAAYGKGSPRSLSRLLAERATRGLAEEEKGRWGREQFQKAQQKPPEGTGEGREACWQGM